ncbi:MAG: PEP-CTERM sorting domain-containing protein [Pirellulales bacterium]
MRLILLLCIIAVLFASNLAAVSAATVFQSGTLGQLAVTNEDLANEVFSGTAINESVFTGVRFEVAQRVTTSRIGGHFLGRSSGETFFGAIVQLESDFDFPDSSDLTSPDVLGITTLTFPDPSAEAYGDISLSIEPGWYALLFGSGLFGADGRGGAIRNGVDIGTPSYISWQPAPVGWFNLSVFGNAFQNHRFVVEGIHMPEPSTFVLLLAGLLGLLGARIRRTGAVR